MTSSQGQPHYEDLIVQICDAMAARADGDLLATPPDKLPPELAALVKLWMHTVEARAIEGDRLHDMALAMVLLDGQELTIKSMNRAALRLFDYDNAGELVYEHVDRLGLNRADIAALTPQKDIIEVQGERKGGGRFDLQAERVGVDADGDLMIGLRDISERLALEQAMQEARDTALHTAELQGHFLANMSHEIRTPVNGILGMAELLCDSELDTEQRQHVEAIHTSGSTLLVLINDILDLSKIESGQMSLDPQPADLKKVVQEVATLMGPRADHQGNRIVIDYPEDVPSHFITDALRFRQVLLNLVGNAVKFTHNGQVTVRARLDSQDDYHCVLNMEVEDSGIGIPEDNLEKIFDKFTQAESSTTRRFGGTGLGLTISRQVASLLDGTLKVSSVQGVGSTFILSLPLLVVATPTQTLLDAQDKAHSKCEVAGLRVLVAEDNPINQTITRRTLEKMGCVVAVVENGADADARAATEHFDIVLMDCMMPDTDGFEGTRRIRARGAQGRPYLPIIALTAKAMKGDRDLCLDAGMDDYLTKPFTSAALRDVLETWCFRVSDDKSKVG